MSSLIECLLKAVFIYFLSQISCELINDKNCGLRPSKLIVEGVSSQPNEYPFMVSVQVYNKREQKEMHTCGGTVLNNRWVLTAAHCIKLGQVVGYINKAADITLVMGSTSSLPEKSVSYKVATFVINGCFLSSEGVDAFDGDIALLMTTEEIDLMNTNIRTICLPPKLSEPIGDQIEVTGWGIQTETNILSDDFSKSDNILKKLSVTLHPEEYCRVYNYFRNLGITEWVVGKRLCMRSHNSTVCRGDSGGPAFQIVNGRIFQFGVASFISSSILSGDTCWKGNPFLYVKVTHYLDWILYVLKNQSYYEMQTSGSTTEC